jgi:hypothetical protein
MLTDSTSPSKDIIWQTGLKRKIQQSVVYKKTISITERWKKIYQAIGP